VTLVTCVPSARLPSLAPCEIRRPSDSELRLMAALRSAGRERGRPLPSIDVADALLDERRVLTEWPWQVSSSVGFSRNE
jgi:hypothetical protein